MGYQFFNTKIIMGLTSFIDGGNNIDMTLKSLILKLKNKKSALKKQAVVWSEMARLGQSPIVMELRS